MVQRKRIKSKSKERSKARLASSRSRAALTDPECLGADVNALVTQRMVGLLSDSSGPFRGSGVVISKALVTKIQSDTKLSLRALFSGRTTFAYCRLHSRPIMLTAIGLWVLRMVCAMRQPLLLFLVGLICRPCEAYSFFSMLKVRQGNHCTRSIIEDGATP